MVSRNEKKARVKEEIWDAATRWDEVRSIREYCEEIANGNDRICLEALGELVDEGRISIVKGVDKAYDGSTVYGDK